MSNLLNPATLTRGNQNSQNNQANSQQSRNLNQNFAEQISVDRATRPKGYFIAFFFELIAVLSAFGLGFQYFRYLTQSTIAPTLTLFEVFWIGIPFTIAHVISFLLIKSPSRRFTLLVLETVALMFFFGGFPNLKWLYFFAIGFAVLFFLWMGERQARNELNNGIKFRFLKVVGPLIAKMVSALVLMGVLLSLPALQNEQGFFRGREFSDLPGWGVRLTQKFFPGFREDTTALSLAKKVAELQLSKNPEFVKLSPNAQELAINQAAEQLVRTFVANETTSTATSTESDAESSTLGTITTQFLNSQLRSWYDKAPATFLFIWAVVLFFVFRGFGAIFGVIIGSMAYVIYQILLVLNIIHITDESKLQEVIEYS